MSDIAPTRAPARFMVAVGSGKGGVGKSTVSLNLALALSQQGHDVGLLDADVYGPNIPLMVNLTRKVPGEHWTLTGRAKPLEPVEVLGIKVMSTGFIVSEDQSVSWDASLVEMLLWQLTNAVQWGDLDFLIIDLPPGTADLQRNFAKGFPLAGVVIVVTPQDVAHLDAKKAVAMFRDAGVRVLGGIENMSAMRCPHCDVEIDVFHPVTQSRSIWDHDVEKLGDIPLDPKQSRATDSGHPMLLEWPDSPQAESFKRIATTLTQKLNEEEAK